MNVAGFDGVNRTRMVYAQRYLAVNLRVLRFFIHIDGSDLLLRQSLLLVEED